MARSTTKQDVAYFIATSVYYLLYSITDMNPQPFQKYISTILQCSANNVTAPVILVGLLYINRYRKKQQFIPPESEYKLWITSLMLADVELNDCAYAVRSWSQVSLIPIQELIHLRRVFLETISYRLHVSELEYSNWIQSLQRISEHVSSCLYYKSPMVQAQMVYQPLMRQNYQHYMPPQPFQFITPNVASHSIPPHLQASTPIHPPQLQASNAIHPDAIHRSQRPSPRSGRISQVRPMNVMSKVSNYMYSTVLPRY